MASCQALVDATPGLTSGRHVLYPAGPTGEAVAAYCDMTQQPAGQSLFDVPSGTMTLEGSRLCTTRYSNDDMDSTMMWVTLEGKVLSSNSYNTNAADWFTLTRDQVEDGYNGPMLNSASRSYLWGADAELYRPTGLGSYDKPIPFPASGHVGGTVVWFTSSGIKFRNSAQDYSFPYPSALPACVDIRLLSRAGVNGLVYVTDGISTVMLATRTSNSLTCMSILNFDWSARYTRRLQPSGPAPEPEPMPEPEPAPEPEPEPEPGPTLAIPFDPSARSTRQSELAPFGWVLCSLLVCLRPPRMRMAQ